jgi:hypothetical protein
VVMYCVSFCFAVVLSGGGYRRDENCIIVDCCCAFSRAVCTLCGCIACVPCVFSCLQIESGSTSFAELAAFVEANGEPVQRSGKQEAFELVFNHELHQF